MCEVTGSRRFSKDLSKRGLEVPCVLKSVGSSKDITKAKKLIHTSLLDQVCTACRINSVKIARQNEIKSKYKSEDKLDDGHGLIQPPAKSKRFSSVVMI